MDNRKKNADRSTWAVGGGLLLGLGVGFFFLKESPLAFVGSMIAGLGLGLMVIFPRFSGHTEELEV